MLSDCSRYIRESVVQGGLVNDAGMACFAEAIAALEQYMERCTADPLGNSDEHLDRAQARARMLDSFIAQRSSEATENDNILEFDPAHTEPAILGDLDLGERQAASVPGQTTTEILSRESASASAEAEPATAAAATAAAATAAAATAGGRSNVVSLGGRGIPVQHTTPVEATDAATAAPATAARVVAAPAAAATAAAGTPAAGSPGVRQNVATYH